MKISLVVVLWLLLPSTVKGNTLQSGHWLLEPGEQREVLLKPGEGLRLSQKNILEVETRDQLSYTLIALHSGLVYVRILDAKGLVSRSWVVEVLQRLHPEKTRILHQDAWRQFFCQELGVQCSPESSLVSGSSSSLAWLHRARTQCAQLAPCRFEVTLTEKGQQHWAEVLREDLKLPAVKIAADGFIRLSMDCELHTQAERDHIVKEIRDRYSAPSSIQCLPKSATRILLEFLAVSRRLDASSLDNPLHWKLKILPPGVPIEAVLDGLAQHGELKIVAKPETLTVAGAEVKMVDGGEIATLRQGRDGMETQWKQVGFQFQGKILEMVEDTVRVRLDVVLSRPQAGLQSLDSSGLQTEAMLFMEQWSQVGTMQALSEGQDLHEIPWLADIPLLGRLFAWQSKAEVRSEILMFIRVSQAKPEEQRPPDLEFKKISEVM